MMGSRHKIMIETFGFDLPSDFIDKYELIDVGRWLITKDEYGFFNDRAEAFRRELNKLVDGGDRFANATLIYIETDQFCADLPNDVVVSHINKSTDGNRHYHAQYESSDDMFEDH